VPPDHQRLKERGFSLPRIICNKRSKNLNINSEVSLKKTKSTSALSLQNRAKRKELVKNCYSVTASSIPKKVFLIDVQVRLF